MAKILLHSVHGRGQIKFNGVKYTIRHWVYDKYGYHDSVGPHEYSDWVFVTRTNDEYHIKYPNNIPKYTFSMDGTGRNGRPNLVIPKEVEMFIRQWILHIRHSMKLKDYAKTF